MSKIYLLILILILFTGCDQANNISRIIENCSDNTIKGDFKRSKDKYYDDNRFFSEKHRLTRNISRHENILKVLNKESRYLESIKEDFYKIKEENKNYVSQLDFMRTKYWDYYQADAWAKMTEQDLSFKRVRSNYFQDYEKTSKRLNKKVKDHQYWLNEAEKRLKKIEQIGEDIHNKEIQKTIDKMEKSQKKFLKDKLKTKLQRNSYEKYFILCEKRRTESPIMFDKKWR